MKQKLNKNLFARFYWDIISENEKDEVFNSIESVEMLEKEWNETNKVLETNNLEEIKRKIDLQLNSEKAKFSIFKNRFLRYAAIFTIPLLLGAIYYYTAIYNSKTELVWLEKKTMRGERIEFILPDGSAVSLNSDSKIIYPQEFEENLREIKLEGEAYFEVKKNKQKPFVVKTKKLNIKVLGTVFNIKSYKSDSFIETTLLSGKVSVEVKNNEDKIYRKAILTPNQQAKYYTESKNLVLDKVDVNRFVSWKQGKLIIENKSFIEVCRELERRYDVDIYLEKTLHEKYFYTFTITNEQIDEILNNLKRITESLVIKYENKKIHISENKSSKKNKNK